MKYSYIDQAFIDNLPTPKDKIKAEYRADNLPKGFRIEIRQTSKGVGTYRYRTKEKDYNLGRSDRLSLEEALQKVAQIIPQSSQSPHTPLLPPITQTSHMSMLSLNAFWEQYYWPHVKTRLRTFRNIESMWRLRIQPVFGDQYLDEVKVVELERFQTYLIESKLSGSHITGHLKLKFRGSKTAKNTA
ncbi:MAG: hypothetical protein GJ671_00005 [Alteromonadaceae bacterium]|nr:hypothetical protein [Alteromonadaceae bacterium]